MSRDLTPKELDTIQKSTNMPNIVDNLTVKIGDQTMPAFTDDEKEISHAYPNLGRFGLDMLNMCKTNGVYYSEDGKRILQKVEDYFNHIEIDDKELSDATQAWYEGTFCPGYYMTNNDSEFAAYLKSKISVKIFND